MCISIGSYSQALVEIGDYIQSCLPEFTTEEEGRTNLWIFVSKFTKDTSEALKILYNRAKKEMESDKQQVGKHQSCHSSLASYLEHFDDHYPFPSCTGAGKGRRQWKKKAPIIAE